LIVPRQQTRTGYKPVLQVRQPVYAPRVLQLPVVRLAHRPLVSEHF